MITNLLSIQLTVECTVKNNSAFNNNQQIYEVKNPNCTVRCLLRVHFNYLTFSYKGRKPLGKKDVQLHCTLHLH